MAKKLPIVFEPKEILRKIAKEVPIKDIKGEHIQSIILSMKETLKHAPDGVGLAAPQINESLQIFLVSEEAEEIDNTEKRFKANPKLLEDIEENGRPYPTRDWIYYVFINPKLIKTSKQKINRAEGCLSVPGVFGNVKRFEKFTVEAYDEHGKKITRGASRFFARVVQHEYDHLHGTLFIDKATGLVHEGGNHS